MLIPLALLEGAGAGAGLGLVFPSHHPSLDRNKLDLPLYMTKNDKHPCITNHT